MKTWNQIVEDNCRFGPDGWAVVSLYLNPDILAEVMAALDYWYLYEEDENDKYSWAIRRVDQIINLKVHRK